MRRLLLVPFTAVLMYGCADHTPTGPLPDAAPVAPRFGAFPGTNGKIVFTSTRDPGGGILTMELGSPDVQTLRSTGGGPSWSADGTRIVFVDFDENDAEIYIMNGDGTGVVQVTSNSAHEESPSWSPDGTSIVFHSNMAGANQIFVIDASGGGTPTALTSGPAVNFGPSYSPDGTKIAFTSFRDGNREIYVMNADGSNQTRLTNDVFPDYDPSWSPDGSRIVFTHQDTNTDEGADIHIMNADGTNPVDLTNSPTTAEVTAAWSPDGSRILFISDRDGNGELYVMWPDGTSQQNLSQNQASEGQPDWQPVPGDPPGPTVAEQVEQLADDVAELQLPKGTAKSMLAILEDVLAALQADQRSLACSALDDFINRVSAQSGKKISAADAAALIQEANAIADQLGCVAGAACYPALPAPQLVLESTTQQNGTVRFELDVTNFGSFPDELFDPAPDLAACGLNTSAARTWVDIYDGNGNFLAGFCSLGQASDLNLLWFQTTIANWPAEAYIVVTDRRCNITYTSNRINLAEFL